MGIPFGLGGALPGVNLLNIMKIQDFIVKREA